jgi:hypothetical protein
MSISWYIYKASPGAGPITTWEVDRSERFALLSTVKERLSSVFPTLRWSTYSFQMGGKTHVAHSGGGSDYKPGDEYLDLSLSADSEGYVGMIVARKASPKVVIAIMKEFGLDSVFQDQPGVMIDPYDFDEQWNPKRC